MPTKGLLPGEAGAILGLTREGVRHLERDGKLKSVRDANGYRRFDPDAVARLAAARRSTTPVVTKADPREERAPGQRTRDADEREADMLAEIHAEYERKFAEWDREMLEQRRARQAHDEARAGFFAGTIDASEAAAILGIARYELRGLVRSGVLRRATPPVGGYFGDDRYERSEVERVREEVRREAERLLAQHPDPGVSVEPAWKELLVEIARVASDHSQRSGWR